MFNPAKYQQALEEVFTSLTVFSDLNWDDVTKEYIASHDERPDDIEDFTFNFPQYLQDKANDGDCPSYLFELAFYELIQNQLLETELEIPKEVGLHLNPTLSFLNLEFDVELMMTEATQGNIQVLQRPHVLCLFRHPTHGLGQMEITTPVLEILQKLENGPLPSIPKGGKELEKLIEMGLILNVT